MGKSVRTDFSGWWLSPTPLKNDGLKVSWDDDIPNIWKVTIQPCSKPPIRYRLTRVYGDLDIS